ncbi:MAG TPA: amino acid adenylation domain-containing protein [Steroidobacteraceae bacterium]|nr:amino acid adenylation domain-containing protein [Steroidobacteraceae bacterium]
MRLEERFEASVRRCAGQVAVQCGSQTWTYSELDRRAQEIAAGLRALGVRPEEPVGLLMRRSNDLVAAIIGVYKAGACYLALDTSYPMERLRYMCEDSSVRFALVEDSLPVTQRLNVRTISISECMDAGRAALPAPSHNVSDGLAYVLYTSGSTGHPKGVAISHAHVDALLKHAQELFAFDETDVWSQVHSHAFDFSVWEIWGALAYGGRLVILPPDVARDPDALCAELKRAEVTVLNMTPAAFRAVVNCAIDRKLRFPALSVVIFGGDALDTSSVRRWFQYAGEDQPKLVNMYGITETTVHVTFCPLDSQILEQSTRTPIGDALAHLSIHALDRHMNPVPEGTTGELYVGGQGLAWGYVGRPALTAQRFVPDPSSAEGGRLYRSGDLGAVDALNCLRFVGRADDQVKVRGHRIELCEVEAALLSHPSVEQVAIHLERDDTGNNLIACVVAAAKETLDLGTLQRHLRQTLPEHMMPAKFLELGALPITPNGKIDRAALLSQPSRQLLVSDEYEAPETSTERLLAEVLADVLKVERVGANDNYFALGGDSIRSIVTREKARQVGLEFSVFDLLLHQTVRELGAAIDRGETTASAGAESTQPFDLISEADRLAVAIDEDLTAEAV